MMQASYYNYNATTPAPNQNSYDVSFDQGTWQQPGAGQSSEQQDSVYYTGVISGAPQSYFTGTPSGNPATANFAANARGAMTNVAKSPKTALSNASLNQTKTSGTQYGANMVQYGAPNQLQYQEAANQVQYQDNAMGYNSNAVDYYGYSNDQSITNSGDMVANSESYNTLSQGTGNNNYSVGSLSTVANSGGAASLGNPNENMGMNSQSGIMNIAGGNIGGSTECANQISNNRNVRLPYKGGGMGHHNSEYSDYQNKMGMAGNTESVSDNYNNNYDGYHNNYNYGCENNGSSYQNFNSRDRGSRFPNQSRGSYRGQFNNSSRGNWRQDNGNNYYGTDSHKRGRREYGYAHHHHSNNVNQNSEDHYSDHFMGRGAGRSLSIQLSPSYYNKWCNLRRSLGKRDSELVEHLLDIHEKNMTVSDETKAPTRKRKVTEETEETPTKEEVEEELTEEEMKMKELMGFSGFKSTKGSKPKSIGFSSFDRANSQETEEQNSSSITTLTPEERKAMASLGGFSVFVKSDNVQPASVGFGAPAVTFTPMDNKVDSNTEN